jgi:elongator complex protein 5
MKIYDGRPAAPASQGRSKRDGRIGYESSDEGRAPVRSGSESIVAGGGHILYTRDSDEEPPDSDEDPDDDLDI